MFKNEDDFKKIVSRLNIDNKPNPVHRENLRRQMLSVFNKARTKTLHAGQWQTIGRTIMKRPITKLAAAAVIIIAVGLFLVHRALDEQVKPTEAAKVTKSPAEMVTLASLTFAYRHGGMEAVEEICDKAFKMMGPRPSSLSVRELFEELNGNG